MPIPTTICGRGRRRGQRGRAAPPRRPRTLSRVHKNGLLIGRFQITFGGVTHFQNAPGYWLFLQKDTPPVETDTPVATSETLPFTPTDEMDSNGVWYAACGYFNGYVFSGFLPVGPHGEPYYRIDVVDGEPANTPPDGPLAWHVEPRADGVLRIHAAYLQHGALRATQWSIDYDDAPATPAQAATVAVAMPSQGIAVLRYDLDGGFSHNDAINVRLHTRRNDGGTWVYNDTVASGALASIKTATADAECEADATEYPRLWPGRVRET